MIKKSLFLFTLIWVATGCILSSPSQPQLPVNIPFAPSSTSIVSSEPVITPTVLSIQEDTFRLQDMNTILPEDIIQETGYFGGMGGGGSCYQQLNYSSPQLEAETQDVEVMNQVSFSICGLRENENIKVSIQNPHGAIKQYNINSQKDDSPQAWAHFEYVPDYQDLTGNYKVIFEGTGWKLTGIMNVLEAPAPRLYRNENQLIFHKFNPKEQVRLFIYNEQKLLGWKAYQMDEHGELVLTTDENENFVALGDISGQAIVHYKGGMTWDGVGDISCPGAPKPMSLSGYQYAEIITETMPAFDLSRGNPLSIPKGTILQVHSQPYCENSQWFRDFSIMGEINQLVSIRYDKTSQFSLRPLAELPPTLTPDAAEIPACPGTLPSRLQVGMNAQVTKSGMAPQLSLRAQPSMNAEKVHFIAASRKMVILEGPVCADGSYWWRIRSEQGFDGWSREGDNEDYWIDPLP